MATQTTLGNLIDQHFRGTLCVTSIGDMKIVITNEPDFDARTFTVDAVGISKKYGYPLFGSGAFTLTDIELSLTYNGAGKASTGSIRADLDFAGIDLNVKVVLSKGAESFSATSQLTQPVALTSVVKNLTGSAPARPPGIAKSARIQKVGMTIVLGGATGRSISVDCKLDSKWNLPIANGTQSVSAGFIIEYAGKRTLDLVKLGLEGDLRVTTTRSLGLSYEFGKTLSKLTGTLSAGAAPVVPADLVKLFRIPVPRGFPGSFAAPKGVDLASAALVVDFENDMIQLSGRNSLEEDAFVRAGRLGGEWIFAIGIATSPGWKMASLSSELEPVDSFLSLEQSFLVISTADQKIDDSIFSRMGSHSFDVVEGLNVGAAIKLDGKQTSGFAKTLRGLLGKDTALFLEATLGTKPKSVTFSAEFEGEIGLRFKVPNKAKPAIVRVEGPKLLFSLEPSLGIFGGVEFPTTSGPVEISGGVDITPTAITFREHTELSIKPPKSAGGLQLKSIGGVLSAEPGAFEIELDGDMYIGDKSAGFAFQIAVPEMVPTYLYARFQSLDLAPMFKALCKSGTLPKSLSSGISFHDSLVWVCVSPRGKCERSDGTTVDAGFAFAGDANVFGFPAAAAVSVTDRGMSGKLAMPKSLGIKGIFVISDANNPRRGPQLALDTSKSPYLNASYYVNVLGVTDTANLELTNQGFLLITAVGFHGRSIKIRCILGIRRTYTIEIGGDGNFNRNPIVINKSIGALGHLKVTIYSVSIGFSLKSQSFHASISYKIKGFRRTTKSVVVTLREIGNDIGKLGKKIEQAFSKIL